MSSIVTHVYISRASPVPLVLQRDAFGHFATSGMSSCPWLLTCKLCNILIDLMACWLVSFLLLTFCFGKFLCWFGSFWMLALEAFCVLGRQF